MALKHIVAAVAAIFATGALAAGDPSNQRPSHSTGDSAGMSKSQGGGQASQSPETVRQAQQQLNSKGYDVGAVDGQIGPKTKEGVKKFQQSQNISPTGQLDRQTLAALGVGEQGSSSSGSSSPGGSSSRSSGSTSGSSGSGAMNQPGSGSGSGPAKSGGPDRVTQ